MSDKNLVLMGVKHCGKSTLGKMLAIELKKDFYDIDKLIEEKYKDKSMSVRDILEMEKKEGFQRLEMEAICFHKDEFDYSIISLGGGTIENDEALSCIAETSVFIYLKDDPEVLFERIKREGIPLFLKNGDAFSNFMDLYERRSLMYEKRADVTVDLVGLDIAEAYEKLKLKLKESGYAR